MRSTPYGGKVTTAAVEMTFWAGPAQAGERREGSDSRLYLATSLLAAQATETMPYWSLGRGGHYDQTQASAIAMVLELGA